MNNQKRYSLRVVIILPFLIVMTLAVGLIAYLSFHSGQAAINDVALELRHEITLRIEENLLSYLEIPYFLIRLNEDVFREELIQPDDLAGVERYFFRIIKQFPAIAFINLGLETGEYVGVERIEDGSLNIFTTSESYAENKELYSYNTNTQGEKLSIKSTFSNWDSRTRPWYKSPAEADKPVWSEVYPYLGSPYIGISAGKPIYDNDGNLIGVLSAEFVLSQIDQYLRQINVGQSGRTFIMERSGLLIGASAGQAVVFEDDQPKRVDSVDSEDPLIRKTALFLREQFTNLKQINTARDLTFEINGARQFLQVTPLKDGRGIDWLIVVVIPESDFMQEINESRQQTLFVSLLILGISLVAAMIFTQYLIQPLFSLNASAKALAKGEWNQELVAVNRSDEIGELARSFQQMAQQLYQFVKDLEHKIAERTKQLKLANEELAQVSQNKDKFFSILAHDLKSPFMPLLGNLELLRDGAEKFPTQEIMKMSADNHRLAERIFDLLDNLLQWAQLQMNRMTYQPERLNLADMAMGNVMLLSENAALKEIDLRHQIDPDVWVYADKHILNTIIRNLTNNALKFTPHSGQVTLLAKELFDENDRSNRSFIEVSIVDTGIGMSADVKQKLFRLDQTVTTVGTAQETGTGLGLIICQEMVIRSGGRIWVDSEVGKGTTVHFTVRLDKAHEIASITG